MSQLAGEARARFVRSMFGRIVPRYDLMNTLMTLGMDRRWRQLTVREAGVPPGGTALDVASGTGELTLALVRQGAGRAIGVDFSQPMLGVAVGKCLGAGAPRCAFVAGDALSLPFPDEAFDAATIGFGLRNMGDISCCLSEMTRVVRRGGRVVCLELTRPAFVPVAVAFHAYFHGLVPLLGGLLSGDLAAYRYLPDSLTTFPRAEPLAALMRRAGLEDVGYRRLALGTIAIHSGERPAR